MTRINTNISALRGLHSVQKANDSLGTSLERLSSGLQINSGKDNPSGLIASEQLRSQITSIQQSINNSNRANNVIATADSALGEISGLLNQVRGLVQEGLNNGALSQSEIDANQQQIDSALSAINRIAGNTSFAGDKLIDGSKAFTTTATTADKAKLSDYGINEALFGSSSTVVVDATITTAASKGTLFYRGGNLTASSTVEVSGAKGSQVLFFGASSTLGDITNAINKTTDVTGVSASSAAGTSATASFAGGTLATDDLTFTAASAGTAGNNTTVAFGTASGSTTTVSVSGSAITVNLAVSTGVQATKAFNGPTTNTYDDLTFTAVNAGTSGNNITVAYTQATDANTTVSASGNAITVALGYDTSTSTIIGTASAVAAAVATTASVNALVSVNTGAGTGVLATAAATNLTSGAASGAIIATASQAAAAITADTNAAALVTVAAAQGTNATTVLGTVAATNLTGGAASQISLTSANFGSSEFVDVNVLSGSFSTVDSTTSASTRSTGTDVAAIINGQVATGKGLQASINSQTLNAYVTFTSASNVAATNSKVTITGGGSVFQIGQDVSANGQIGIGIDAVNTARLGGTAGKLYELGSGGGKSLNDVGPNLQGSTLVDIIGQAIDKVSTLRGRLGALQKNVIETNISSLSVALENISSARSQIVDTDFAAETANLTKNQILSQSSLTVLGIANQQPNQVLSLLRQ